MVPTVGRAGLYRRVFHAALKHVARGTLTLCDADGEVTLGSGDAPYATLRILDPRTYQAATWYGDLGLAEAYLNGWWQADDLTAVFRIAIANLNAADRSRGGLARLAKTAARGAHWLRRNTPGGSRRNIQAHYDLGNDMFEQFLDETMTYSAGVFEGRDTSLAQAQRAKLDRLCLKLDLRPEDHLLEIGTGWGSMAIHAATHYGCRVTTTTISDAQHDLAAQRIAAAGLEDRITLLKRDYRDLEGQFDKLVSVEMIEAVGHEFLPEYFARCAALLKPTGAMAIQAITMPDRRYPEYLKNTDFIKRYIFPGCCVPSMSALLEAAAPTDLTVTHVEDIGLHYAETLRRWHDNFQANWDAINTCGYDKRFRRLWEYYLCYCEAGFATRYLGDQQIVFRKPDSTVEPAVPPLPACP
ncbi:MAG: class I SAM-dependent methyltransferase, partial [Gammaproteobacteria bacterium]|nr:cyclopropane-fatty-acyl-phospholipid synthase family protein [Gammaproteobacteria bacterium]NNL99312.1 class I SAM-dependent methyltransferase [Gammaproteobacteria bacterium]